MASPRPRLVSSHPPSEASPSDLPLKDTSERPAAETTLEPFDPLLEFPTESAMERSVTPAAIAPVAAASAPALPVVAAPQVAQVAAVSQVTQVVQATQAVPKPPSPPKVKIAITPQWPSAPRWLIAVVISAIGVAVGAGLVRSRVIGAPSGWFGGRAPAKVTIDTRPAGAEILVDGQLMGVAPATLSLTPGPHTMIVRRDNDERVLPLTLASGAEIAQYFEMRAPEPVAVPRGSVAIVTDPPGGRVRVDGQMRGVAPLNVTDLSPGEHKVAVVGDTGVVEKKVVVEAGAVASVVFSAPKSSAPVGGWLTVSAPFDVQVVERDEVVGSGNAARIMLAAGRHDVVLTNDALGFQEPRRLDIAPGRTTAIKIDAPKASLSINARPWADVIVDGNNAGQTPIANLVVPVGPHQVILRHPQFGERRQTVMVTTKGPNRIGVDFTKPQ